MSWNDEKKSYFFRNDKRNISHITPTTKHSANKNRHCDEFILLKTQAVKTKTAPLEAGAIFKP
jgi:hypothetical protein